MKTAGEIIYQTLLKQQLQHKKTNLSESLTGVLVFLQTIQNIGMIF